MSNIAKYREVLATPGAIRLLLAALPARMAYGMISLAIYFKVQTETGSIAAAGLATGVNALAGALTAGMRGAMMDRFGMKWPLRILVPGYAIMVVALSFGSNRSELIAISCLLGLTAPPINLSVRPLWQITVTQDKYRIAFAIDTSAMNSVGVFAPVLATSLALSVSPEVALRTCAALIALGGILLLRTSQVRSWKPEEKGEKPQRLWRVVGIQILAIEGIAMGLGWGAFDIAVPALGTLENVPERVGVIFAIMAAFTVAGGLVAGTLSRHISPLRAFRFNYLLWAIFSIPLALTSLDWSIALVTAFLAFFGGAQQVFYWEITEAVRPQGTAVKAMAWLWTIEGTAAAIGVAIGGFIAEHYSPRYCLLATTIFLFIGYFIISIGRKSLSKADRIPASEPELHP